MNRTGCSWRRLPHDFLPWDPVYWYFQRWNAEGTTDRIHDALRAAVCDGTGRHPLASAAIVDAQSVKGADTVPAASRGHAGSMLARRSIDASVTWWSTPSVCW